MEYIEREDLEDAGRIIHDTEIDIGNKRPVITPIHIVQYDNTLPVIAVKIFKDGDPIKLQDIYSCNLRWKDPKGTIRYEAVMGRSDPADEDNFTTIYFTVDVDMTQYHGEVDPVLEFTTDNMSLSSSPIPFVIHRNPIQNGDVEEAIKGVVLAPVAFSGSYSDLTNKPSAVLTPKFVTTLPEVGEPEYLYLVKRSGSQPEDDVYDEYIWVIPELPETPHWEILGSTKVYVELDAASGEHINEVGTPSVTKSFDQITGKFIFTFNYLKGQKGDKGNTGSQGPKGDDGEQGEKGDKGDKGDTGEQGPKGDTGSQGPKGDKGDKGDTGEQGPQGPPGEVGDVESIKTQSTGGATSINLKEWVGTQAQFDSIATKDPYTRYTIIESPTGHTVTFNYSGIGYNYCQYSLDNGETWIGIESDTVLTNVTQIKFRVQYISKYGSYQAYIESAKLGLHLEAQSSQTYTESQNYILTQDIDDINSMDYCFVKGTQISLADGTTKNVEDIAYDDELMVWNLYEGKLDTAKPSWIMREREAKSYKKVTLSNGIILKLIGPDTRCHRLFNVTKQQFLYANECVGDEVYTLDGIARVLSCELVPEKVKYYNLTTEKYYDCFAEKVLTGSRLNNMYHITDMKYDSDEQLISDEEITERWEVRERFRK